MQVDRVDLLGENLAFVSYFKRCIVLRPASISPSRGWPRSSGGCIGGLILIQGPGLHTWLQGNSTLDMEDIRRQRGAHQKRGRGLR